MRTTAVEELRLSRFIREEKLRIGSYEKLEDEVSKVTGVHIDRRKLSDIVGLAYWQEDGSKRKVDVNLRVTELAALDTFLRTRGKGLSSHPLFEGAGVLTTLGRSSEVALLLGARASRERQRDTVSVWDSRSQADLMSGVYRAGGNSRFFIEHVMYQDAADPDAYEHEGWVKNLTDHPRRAAVALGSPRVSRASEVMLARMFGVRPFRNPDHGEPAVPFVFIWSDCPAGFRSRFANNGSCVAGTHPAFYREVRSTRERLDGLAAGDRLFEVRPDGDTWHEYGVIAVQRRADGQVWLALCGVSGPSTQAAARALEDVRVDIPSGEPGQDSPVLWAVVKVHVTRTESPGDRRQLGSHELVYGPFEWHRGQSAARASAAEGAARTR